MLSRIDMQDENGNYLVSYAELVPLLVSAYQNVVSWMRAYVDPHFPTLYQREEGTENGDETQENQPRMTSRLLDQAVLYLNSPNPFTSKTEIRFHLPDNMRDASICIFDMQGKMMKQIPVHQGQQSVTINGYELAAGMYLYALIVNGQEIDTKRMILSK